MIDEILHMIRTGSSEHAIRKHIELAIALAVCDAKIEAYKQGAQTVTEIFKNEVSRL